MRPENIAGIDQQFPAQRPATGRRRLDRWFVVFCVATAMVSVVVLAVLLISILVEGSGHLSWRFLTGIPDPDPALAGIWPALGGTIWVCLVCALFTLPIGVATAIFLEEFQPRHPLMRFFHGVVQLNITNLAGVPSVVYGIIGLTAFVAMFGMFGRSSSPVIEFGAQWFDQFALADSDGISVVNVVVGSREAPPTEIAPGLAVESRGADGPAVLCVIGPWEPLPADRELQGATVRRGSEPVRRQAGGEYFDEFTTFSGAVLSVPVADGAAPPTRIGRGMKAFNSRREQIRPRVLDSGERLTVFLKVGSPPRRVQAGGKFYDQFLTADGHRVRIPVESRTAAPTAIENDAKFDAITDFDHPVLVVGSDVARRSKYDARFDEMVRADPEGGRIPRFRWYYFGLPLGRSVLAGGLTLMLVILPIVIIASQESLRAVPNSLREGALGMGATPWQVVWNITLPAAVPGIMTGSILAMSRAIGEAAPILIICGIVFIASSPSNLMDSFTVMPLQIYNWASRPQAEFREVAATGIIVLLAVLLSFNAIAVLIRQKLQKPLS